MLPRRIEREEVGVEVEVDLGDLDAPASPPARRPRVYRLRDAAWLLGAFAATLLLLDADGLHAWVTRMEVGPAQDFWASLVEPWRRVAARAGLTAPRRAALAAADRLAAAFAGQGGAEDLLARGWTPASPAEAAEAPAVAVVPSPPAAAGAPPPAVVASAAAAPGTAVPVAPAPGAAPPRPAAAVRQGAPPAPPTADAPAPVLLLGDSLMVTMAPAVTRAFDGDAVVKLVVADRSATGLSRPDIYDWPTVASTFIATHHPRLVVCAFGGNDAQDVRDPGGKVLRFGTDAWDALYAERIRTMITLLHASGAEVLWLALPPMRPHAFDARMRHLNALYAQEAGATAGVTYEETSALVGKDGKFAEYLRGPRGKLVRVRTSDGIHYAEDGARLVASRIRAWVDERLGVRVTSAGAAPADGAAR